ncbi:unnamed protein product [Blepharisma stoltei]|uniref:non-specific serine/threonine protein kinase n=1 Tax=Blepharisma stoltei TaxID=1481888 RepID=A0AAU9JMN1_9CILI|nr:unnamed protein product [Blepharisma stoltei]
MEEFDKGEYHDKFSDFYVYIDTIGSGSFGKVVHAIDKSTGEEVAIKIIEKHNVKQGRVSELKQEAEILSSLNHPNIIKFKHLKETDLRLFIVMEMIYGGNLKQYIQKNQISDLQASQIMKGILQAVVYIHDKNLIHRDIKPENILVPENQDLSAVKIIDFGLSTLYDSRYKHFMENEKCGTLLFMAPEQASSQSYSKTVDIWSCGILLYMILSNNSHPLAKPNEKVSTYLEKLKRPKWHFHQNFSKEAKSLFLKLTEMVPLERYTASQALNHPWILRSGKEIPLTSFEIFKRYGEELKLKGIIYSILFSCIVSNKNHEEAITHKAEDKKSEAKTPEVLKNRLNLLKEEYELKRLMASQDKPKESKRKFPVLPPLNHPKIYKTARHQTPLPGRDWTPFNKGSSKSPLTADSSLRMSQGSGNSPIFSVKHYRMLTPSHIKKRLERKVASPARK